MKLSKTLLVSILLCSSSTVFAKSYALRSGGTSGVGGGGNAVLCYAFERTRNEVFDSVVDSRSPFDFVNLQLNQLKPGFKPQLLDLWDARKSVGFPGSEITPVLNNKTPEQIYKELLPIVEKFGRLAGAYDQSAKEILEESRTTPSQWKAEENGVIRIEDATIQSYFPKNCLVAQVAFYDDRTNVVHYDARILRLMEKTDQNALRVHEDFYRAVRLRGVQLEKALESLYSEIEAAYNSSAYRNGASVDTSGVAVIRKAIAQTRTSDLTRQLVANLFTTKTYGKETSQKLADAIMY
jgi:hypothetical protein